MSFNVAQLFCNAASDISAKVLSEKHFPSEQRNFLNELEIRFFAFFKFF